MNICILNSIVRPHSLTDVAADCTHLVSDWRCGAKRPALRSRNDRPHTQGFPPSHED